MENVISMFSFRVLFFFSSLLPSFFNVSRWKDKWLITMKLSKTAYYKEEKEREREREHKAYRSFFFFRSICYKHKTMIYDVLNRSKFACLQIQFNIQTSYKICIFLFRKQALARVCTVTLLAFLKIWFFVWCSVPRFYLVFLFRQYLVINNRCFFFKCHRKAFRKKSREKITLFLLVIFVHEIKLNGIIMLRRCKRTNQLQPK